jgi:hypothetical protein
MLNVFQVMESTHDVLRDVDLALVLFRAISVAAVNL